MEGLYTKPVIEGLTEILSSRTVVSKGQDQVSLAAQLISKTCRDAHHQALLVKAGVLDLLASRVAAFAMATGSVPNGAAPSIIADLPPAPSRVSFPYILGAVEAIIRNSAYRSARFLYSPAIIDVFPGNYAGSTSQHYQPFVDNSSVQQNFSSTPSIDRLLPQIQAVQTKSEHSFSKAFPALGSFVSPGDGSRMPNFADSNVQPSMRTVSTEELGSPVIAWLLYMARTTNGLDRLSVVSLLVWLVRAAEQNPLVDPRAETSNRNRDRTWAYLLVPLIVKMIDEAASIETKTLLSSGYAPSNTANEIKEQAPMLLGLLVEECASLQKAAVGAGAIKKLCQILKKSFDPAPPSAKPMWSPHPGATLPADSSLDPRATTLGKPGLSPDTVQAFKCREGALKALAAIAQKDDSYRKQMIENGIVTCITDSLIPMPDKSVSDNEPANGTSPDVKEGNPVDVLIAACNATRAMSRSVNILRTSLIDGGIAKPIFALLKHPDVKVQTAATDVLCNLLLNFSPMREVGQDTSCSKETEKAVLLTLHRI